MDSCDLPEVLHTLTRLFWYHRNRTAQIGLPKTGGKHAGVAKRSRRRASFMQSMGGSEVVNGRKRVLYPAYTSCSTLFNYDLLGGIGCKKKALWRSEERITILVQAYTFILLLAGVHTGWLGRRRPMMLLVVDSR